MPKITIVNDCGNAPKRQLLRDLNIAFARSDVDAILAYFTEDIIWRIVGEREIRGEAAVRQELESMQGVVTRELVIHSIITHGREGAINGEVITQNGEHYAFCDICQFSSAAGKGIKSMKSYTVTINTED